MSPIEELLLESNWKRTRTPIIVASSFILSFVITRAYTHLYPGSQLSLGGLHLHHINYGIMIVSLSAVLSVYYMGPRITEVCSVLLGGGLALVVDEFWLLVTEDFTFPNYWGLDLRVAAPLATILAVAMLAVAYGRRYAYKEQQMRQIIGPSIDSDSAGHGLFVRLARTLGFNPPRRKLTKPRDYAVILAGDSSRFHREGGMLIIEATGVAFADITAQWKKWRSMRLRGTIREFVKAGLRS